MPPPSGAQSAGMEREDGAASSFPTTDPRPVAGDGNSTSGHLTSSAILDPAKSRQQSLLHTSRGTSSSQENQGLVGRLGGEAFGSSLSVKVADLPLAPLHHDSQSDRRQVQTHLAGADTSIRDPDVDHRCLPDSPVQRDLCRHGRFAHASRCRIPAGFPVAPDEGASHPRHTDPLARQLNGVTRVAPALGRNTDAQRRISAPNGLSHHERDLLTESLRYMRACGPCVFVSIQAGHRPDAENIVRRLTRKVRSDLAQLQRRAGMRRVLTTTVFEALGRNGSPKFNSHIVAVMPNALAREKAIVSLNRCRSYGHDVFDVDGDLVLAKSVTDWSGLSTYLLKEATPQAWFGAGKSFRRVGGSIRLGDLGGDRVVVSRALKSALICTGRIMPYLRSYARRMQRAE